MRLSTLRSAPHLQLLCAALLLGACGDAKVPGVQAAADAGPIPVDVQTVGTQALSRELPAVGSVRSDESVTASAEIAGRIVRVGFDEGQRVTAGQVLFQLDDAVPRAEFGQARASHTLAQRSHDRARELHARRLVSPADLDQASANLDVARATLALAQARLDKTRILAPFAGIAGLRQVSPGDYVSAGQPLVNVEALDSVKIDFRVDEAALPALAIGQHLQIEVDACPGQTFPGELYAIEPRIADTTRSIGLRARLANPDGRLRPGLFARVRLVVERKMDAIVIPEQAIFPRGDTQYVYVVEGDTSVLRKVRIGQRLPGQAEIIEGLSAGESLVVSGLQRLSDGSRVAPRNDRSR